MALLNEQIKEQIAFCLEKGKKIAIMVGAGISAESGIPTFRGKDGYWVSGSRNYKAQEIGTLEMFQDEPEEVWKWFLYRKTVTDAAEPNQSHFILKDLDDLLGDQFALISQNVDGLHRRAGSSEKRTHLIHGDFDFVRCGEECSKETYPFPPEIPLVNRNKDVITAQEWEALKCPKCGARLRPHVLWFDEMYNEYHYHLETVLRISKSAGLLFIIGTSGATNLPQIVANNLLQRNGVVVEVNIDESYFSRLLASKKNGYSVRAKSTPFLTELKAEIELQLTK